jgi:DNA-binding GntR family transcriptional regulator
VYHLLGLLESDAAAVVAAAATDNELRELQDLHEELERAAGPAKPNRERFFQINEQFHKRLLEIANNRWRDQMVADLRKVMKLNRHNSLLKSGRIQESLNEHKALMAALAARDSDLCRQRMQQHFKGGLEAAA